MHKKIFLTLLVLFVKTTTPSKLNESLADAVKTGDGQKCRSLIQDRADVNCIFHGEEFGRTPLGYAIRAKNKPICELLIECKADIEAGVDYSGATALCRAFTEENYDICELLLKNKAQVNAVQNSIVQRNVLKAAVNKVDGITENYGDCDRLKTAVHLVGLFLTFGADPAIVVADSGLGRELGAKLHHRTIHYCSMIWAQQVAMVRHVHNAHMEPCAMILFQYGNANQITKYGVPLLHIAVRNGHYDMCKLLLDRNADVNKRIEKSYVDTPLATAVLWKRDEICGLLVTSGAVVDERVQNLATQCGSDYIQKLLGVQRESNAPAS